MNKYELTVVVSAKLDDEGRTAEVEKVKALIEKFGGTITKIEEAGKKKLAYEIKKFKEATYMLFNFEAKPDSIKELERVYRITDDIIKFIVVRKEA